MIKRFVVIIVVFVTSITVKAQRNSSSPYSFFGIGEQFNPKTVEQASMGGIGVAIKDSRINFTNPAANANLRYTTYSLGGDISLLNFKNSAGSQSNNTTNLRYISLGFPIGKKAGFSVGLQPLSSIGYSLSNLNEANTELIRYSGTGGTNRLYGGFGISVSKGVSFGVEGSFIFGNVDSDVTNQIAGVQLGTKTEENLNIRGGQLKVGAQYVKELTKKLEFNLGLAVTLEHDLNVKGTRSLYAFSYNNSGIEIPRDTASVSSIKGKFTNAAKTVVGAGLGKQNKWYAGVNYEFQQGINNQEYVFTGGTDNNYTYGNAYKVSLGGFYLPKINSISSYWDRVTYRAGVRFEDTGLLIDSSGQGNNFTAINDFGMSFGLDLPLGNRLSNINLGFEYGQKGTTNNNLIQENYFTVRLGLSLNDVWFRKRKID